MGRSARRSMATTTALSRRGRINRSLSDLELRAWQALLHAHEDVVDRLDKDLRAAYGISFNDYDVLLRLARADGHALRMAILAERVMMPASSLTRVVDRLVRRELVGRRRVPADARVMEAYLTQAGRTLLKEAARLHVAGIRQHFTDRLDRDQLRDLADILEIIAGPHRPH